MKRPLQPPLLLLLLLPEPLLAAWHQPDIAPQSAGGASSSASARDNWRRLANLNDVVYDVGGDHSSERRLQGTSYSSYPMSTVSFIPSVAALPPMSPPPSPSPAPPISPVVDGVGCTDPNARNYNPSATRTVEGACKYPAIQGCTDSTKFGYIETAEEDDGTCMVEVFGCASYLAGNFDSNANQDDGSCRDFGQPGCTDSTKLGFQQAANVDDGSCKEPIEGCMFAGAANFDSSATIDTGCVFKNMGCTDPIALNYESEAEMEHWDPKYDCKYDVRGCGNPNMWNFDSAVTVDDGSCLPGRNSPGVLNERISLNPCLAPSCDGLAVEGCRINSNLESFLFGLDPDAATYLCGEAVVDPSLNPVADMSPAVRESYEISSAFCDGNTDPKGTCLEPIFGCMEPNALNYDSVATITSGGCIPAFPGCADSNSISFSPDYNVHIATECVFPVYGCAYKDADMVINFNPEATMDDGSCTFKEPGCTQTGMFNYVSYANWDDGSCMPPIDGCMLEEAMNYNPNATTMTGVELCTFPTFGCADSTSINYLGFIDDTTVPCPVANPRDPTPAYEALCQQKSPYSKKGYDACLDALSTACPCSITGCMDLEALNYNYQANVDYWWTCTYPIFGCMDPTAQNYWSLATNDDPLRPCVFVFYGCLESGALNYDPSANVPSMCEYPVKGCMEEWADNYAPDATVSDPDDPCFRYGCMDSTNPFGYDPLATLHDKYVCPVVLPGCLDKTAVYYDSWANFHDPSLCVYPGCGDASFDTYVAKGSESYCCWNSFPSCLDVRADNYAGDFAGGWCLRSLFAVFRTLLNDPALCVVDTTNCKHVQSLCKIPGCMDSADSSYMSDATYHAWWTCSSSRRRQLELGAPPDHSSSASSSASSSSAAAARRGLQSAAPGDGCRNLDALNFDSGDVTHVGTMCVFAVSGCMDSRATNYAPAANQDDGSCNLPVPGCILAAALNYDSTATVDDASCRFAIVGCTDSTASNFVAEANTDSGGCLYPRYGCMAPSAINYDSSADASIGCRYNYLGCTDSSAGNFNPSANIESGTCQYFVGGCLSPSAINFNSLASVDDGSCVYAVLGCTDSQFSDYKPLANVMQAGGCIGIDFSLQKIGCTLVSALNYDSTATTYVDGACLFGIRGCTDSTKPLYNALATFDDGSCDSVGTPGCTNPLSPCYESTATVDDGSCVTCPGGPPDVPGCMNSLAINYLPFATVGDGSCILPVRGCADPAAANYDSQVTAADVLLCVYPIIGCTHSDASNYMAGATAEAVPSTCTFGGCTDPAARNFNPSATFSTGFASCDFPVYGCPASVASNYNSNAEEDDGSCVIPGCMDSTNPSYDPIATQPPPGVAFGGCVLLRPGCTNTYAANYEASANVDDGSCFLVGCTNPIAPNYDWWATTDSGGCDVGGLGCTDSRALNFVPKATADNGLCQVPGCMDSLAINFFEAATFAGVLCIAARPGCTNSNGRNYDPSFNVDNGQCTILGCTDSYQLNYRPDATLDLGPGQDGACVVPKPGCTALLAANFNSTANLDDGSCAPTPPPSPAPLPPGTDPLTLGLETTRTVVELDALTQAELQASVGAFIGTVPSEAPDLSEPSGRRARRLSESTLEPLTGWVADADWRVEYARRIARSFWLPAAAVTFAAASAASGVTVLEFEVASEYLPAGSSPTGLQSYATSLAATAYGQMLSIPVLSVSATLASEGANTPQPPPAPPTPPPETVTRQATGLAPGVLVGIIVPIVAVIVIVAVGGYWYYKRKKKRIPLATVEPGGAGSTEYGSGGGGQLVQPPEIPE